LNAVEPTASVDGNHPLRGIFTQAAVGIAHCAADGRVLLVNQKLCEILGVSTNELVQRSFEELAHPDDLPTLQRLLRALATGRTDSFTFETRCSRPDGSLVWVNTAVSAIRDDERSLSAVGVVVQDISDRKDAESAYRRSAEQIERLYRISNAVIRAEDVHRIFDLALEGLQEALGADRAAVLLYEADDVMRFKAWTGLSDSYRNLVEGHSPWPRDARDPQPVLMANVAQEVSLGELREKITSHGIQAVGFVPLVFEDQLLGKLMIYYNEPHSFTPDEVQVAQTIANHVAFAISRKLAEEKLRLYQQIVQNSVDAIAIIDPEGQYIEQNKAHAELLGYSTHDLEGQTPAIHLGEETFTSVADALRFKGIYRGEATSKRKDGAQVALELSAFAVRSQDGQPLCYVGIKRDISERKKAEVRLRESEERFRVMADTAPIMLWVADTEGNCTWFNRPWLEFTGRPMEKELGYGWCEGVHAEDLDTMRKVFRAAYEDRKPTEMEYRLRRRDGEYRWILDHGVPRFNADGEFVGYVGSCKDITDRKLAQQAIERANQELERRVAERTSELMAANQELEGFTYSVSHDLRGPLRAIMATSRILLDECSPLIHEDHVELLQRQAENAKRLGNLIDDLLKLSRLSGQEITRAEVDVSALAQDVAEELFAREWRTPVSFVVQRGMNAQADQKLLRFVLLNLMENACKFSPEGGAIEVGSSDGALYVRDKGIGFDMEYAPKVFMPFERLVREDEFPGTGIGLANVKRIVERHHGRVWAESEPGKGTTFYFTLGY
jgi:PAS domain S-box-containing protein